MPRYYCDYCDTYLTHDSPSVRKQHNAGYKHKANVRTYYQQFEEQQTQSLIDQRIKEHLGQTAAFGHQVGASFQQHLVSFQSNPQRPRLPVLPPPGLPIAASSQAPINSTLLPGMRPALLPRPLPGFPGYGAPPTVPLSLAPPGATSLPMQMNSLPRLPTMNPPATGGMITNGGYDASNVRGAPILQRPGGPSAPPSGSASQDGFTYSQTSETNH